MDSEKKPDGLAEVFNTIFQAMDNDESMRLSKRALFSDESVIEDLGHTRFNALKQNDASLRMDEFLDYGLIFSVLSSIVMKY